MAHQFFFGTGNIYIIPSGANPTPISVAAIQNASVDFDGDLKQLFGQNSFPLDTARGKTKITGKFEMGQANLALWNAVFFGQTVATGQTLQALNEAASVPTTPYQVTVANGATFATDLGVFLATTGVPLTRVAASPATGQYSVNTTTGVYTFAAADTTKAMIFNYEYASSSTGNALALTNTLMGNIPVFGLHLNNITKSKQSILQLYACTSSKLQFPLKQDDYGLLTIDFSAQDDGTGRILNWSTTEG